MSMLPRHGKCAMCGYDWDKAASDSGPVLKIFNKAAAFCGLPGQGVVWDVPHGTEVRDIPQGVTVQTRRPAGEPGTLWLHYKDGGQIPFSEAAGQTISDVLKAYKHVVIEADEADFIASLKNRDGL